MRITSKGQVTIPVEVRRRLGLLPNTEVEFEIDGETVRLSKAKTKTKTKKGRGRGEELLRRLRLGRTKVCMTTDEIMALTRGE